MPASSPAARWSPVFGRVRAWDDVDSLLGPSDGGDVSAEKAKGQFSGKTSKTSTSLRAAGPDAGEAQAQHQQAVTVEDAGGEVNVSDGPTL